MLLFKKSKGNSALIVLIIVLAVVAVAAVGIAIYFWQKSKPSNVASVSPSPTKTITTSPSKTATPVSVAEESPKTVVENFLNTTLGTLPGANVNYDLARTYMAEDFKALHLGEGWVPQLYGIQDGPSSVNFISENITSDTATVRFDPSWGEMSLAWAFTLEKQNNKWLISDFRNDAQ